MNEISSCIDDSVFKQWLEPKEAHPGQYVQQVKKVEELGNISEKPRVIILGLNDLRGITSSEAELNIPHSARIRDVFYRYYNWHPELDVFDIGDVKMGATIQESYSIIQQVVEGILYKNQEIKVKLILFGGGADSSLGVYRAYKSKKQRINAIGIGSNLPIIPNDQQKANTFLLDMLMDEDSHLELYSHLAYQSYLNSVELLTKLDQFSFENVRLGQVKEDIDEMEYIFRSNRLTFFDLRAAEPTAYPMFHESPHGLSGEEACRLMQFAGMSTSSGVVHIAGYDARKDIYNYYAMLVAQMMWYVIDGFARYTKDIAPSTDTMHHFKEYKVAFSECMISFFKSKLSGRWWMLSPDKHYIPCSYKDYDQATQQKIPDKWLRSIN